MTERTLCFSGYRPEKLNIEADRLTDMLNDAVAAAIRDGYMHFISGMARGFDMLAARAVLNARHRGAPVILECALPFEAQTSGWSGADIAEHKDIMKNADRLTVVCEQAKPESYLRRNRYMVEHSAMLICYFDGQPGGTAYTRRYAKKRGLNIVNLAPFDEQLSFA